jgi:hypothetical protein
MERAVDALVVFVKEWGLALNPEHLYEIAYAVLVNAGSERTYDEIDRAVRQQLSEFAERQAGLYTDDAGASAPD